MALGRENPGNHDEDFCMTVLGLRLSRRANAVSALHGEVSRAMWTGLYPGKAEDAVPIGHITNGVHVPSWLAPQMFRLYDRHLGTGWHEHSGEAAHLGRHRKRRRRRTVGNAPQPEVAAAGIRAPARGRAGRAPRRTAGRSAEARPRVQSRRAHHRLRAALRHLQARQSDSGGHREAGLHGQRRQAPGAVRFRRQGASARRTRQARAAADRRVDARSANSPTNSSSSKTTTSTSAAIFVQGVDVWLNNPRRPLEASGTSGQKVVLNGGLNLSVLDGWWAEAYDGLNGFAIGTGRTHSNMDVHDTPRRRRSLPRPARRSDSALLPARPRRPAARLDQAHEAHHPHPGLALQRRPHGDGLHPEMLRSGCRRHFQRYAGDAVVLYPQACFCAPGSRRSWPLTWGC